MKSTPVGMIVTLIVGATLIGCVDVRDFEGTWTGTRVGDAEPLRIGFADEVGAVLIIEDADMRSLRAQLTLGNDLISGATIQQIPGTQADVLSEITFAGAPSQVYMAFAATTDSGGDAMVMVALYNDSRVEVRVLRGGARPLYGIFLLWRED